jgi:putative nucleotidyltransferase with HDIG domain
MLLHSCCRESDLVARTGGDEFGILLPDSDSEHANKIVKAIRQACEAENSEVTDTANRISLSAGYGTKSSPQNRLEDAEQEAEEYLRRRKFFEQKSIKNAMLSSIMATLYARSQETEEHSQRIAEGCIKVAEKLGLSQNMQDMLRLSAMLHDIGKVGIADKILNKPDKLNDEEWMVMRTHSEIGYHLVMSVPELAAVEDYILAHHERWDGTGYPLGLSGEDIPLLSRILAVADAYDAMLSSRAYRKAMSKKAALEEIEKNSGSQFDPQVVVIFLELMQDKQ